MTHFDFGATFRHLTGNIPFPWQDTMYERFDRCAIPASCNLPTGLGKTNVIAVWLIALLNRLPDIPRRLVYVVNRRTVVDQTTSEVEKIRSNLEQLADVPEHCRRLAISTLRGQFADNREWSADPSRPAVICGTVDMIGSRLLFSGYGVGFKARPLHAGFLGQDALVVHDEAHLEPAFQHLLLAIQAEQKRCGDFRRLHVMELTATSRGGTESFPNEDERLANEMDEAVQRRIRAVKSLTLHELSDEKKELAAKIEEFALTYKDSQKAILIFVRKVDDVEKIVRRLTKEVGEDRVQQLTGTLRGLERDRLADSCPIFARFLPPPRPDAPTVYLVCTSAGEVGVNLSADHLLCDLSTFESMAQRFGRVNRFGERADTKIHVFYPNEPGDEERTLTLGLLALLDGDGSPAAFGRLWEKAATEGQGRNEPSTDRIKALRKYVEAVQKHMQDHPGTDPRTAAFAPPPTLLPTSDILFDAWALTTIRHKLPGRPMVEPFLHGVSAWEPPETHIAWRQEVSNLNVEPWTEWSPAERESFAADLLDAYPLKPHELLRDNIGRVFDRLKKLRAPDETPVWLLSDDERVQITTLGEVRAGDKDDLAYRTVLLPPSAGGLKNGMFVSESTEAADVADQWRDENGLLLRKRIWDGDDESPVIGMELRFKIEFPSSEDVEAEPERVWLWFVRPRAIDAPGAQSNKPYPLQPHLEDARAFAEQMVRRLDLPTDIGTAVILAAHCHDLGKRRLVWQNGIGNMKYPEVEWAKSGSRFGVGERSPYRHEFGSVLDVADVPEFKALPADMQELVLHLIAAHHGRARPHFPAEEAFDFRHDATQAALEVPRRFARLQRRYGRWGLAYLESLVRAADILASRKAEGELL